MRELDTIIHKEMTRKEFLATVGFGLASVFGLGTVIRLLSGKNSHARLSGGRGYGVNSYGG